MKRLLFGLFSITFILASCSKEEEIITPPAPNKYTITVTAEAGGSVSSQGGTYNEGSKITITATPDGQYLFEKWSDGSTVNPREITVTSNLTLSATFVKKTYPLSVTIEGEGTVQEEVIIQGSTSETEYNAGTTVRLTATPNEGWIFAGWSGDVESENSVIEVTIDKGMSIIVTFQIDTEYISDLNSISNQKSGAAFWWFVCGNNLQTKFGGDWSTYYCNFNGGHAYGDINGDGYSDILVSPFRFGTREAHLSWFIYDPITQSYNENREFIQGNTEGYDAHKILKTDVNNDGLADYIALGVDERTNNYGGNFTVLLRNSVGFELIDVFGPVRGGWWFHNGAAGDLNNDGNVDVISAGQIWLGDGKGGFQILREIDEIKSPLTYEIFDINRDGYNDMILSTISSLDKTTIVWGNNIGIDKLDSVNEYVTVSDIEIYDFDSDGDYDIIELRQNDSDGSTKLFLRENVDNSFAGIFEIQNSIDGNYSNGEFDRYGWSVFKIDDIDGDGIDDIVPENYHEGDYNGLKKINNVWTKHNFGYAQQ